MRERTLLCLEFDTFDLQRFDSLRENLSRDGVRFRSLAEEQIERPDTWLVRFAQMDNATRTSDPYAPRTAEEIAERIADIGPELAGCVVADDGTRLIGYTCFHRAWGEDHQRARQGWTGVRPECRRKGIATALKIEGIVLAMRLGYQRIVTDPLSVNIASVRMSERLGFRPCTGDAGTWPP